jgi:hypothetical protein
MNPSERLKEIDNKKNLWRTSEDSEWLINRVKQLTEALEKISACNKPKGSFSGDLETNYWREQELYSRELASKAMDEE